MERLSLNICCMLECVGLNTLHFGFCSLKVTYFFLKRVFLLLMAINPSDS